MNKKHILFYLLLILCSLVILPQAMAANYPRRDIRGIVPYTAGGSTDVVFRAIVSEAPKYLHGRSIIIVNKGGGSGSVGGNYVAKTKADGYTILLAPTSVVDIYPHLSNKPAYRLGDLVPVCVVTVDPRVCVVSSKTPWHDVKELVDAALKNPDTIRFSSPGITSWGAFGSYCLSAITGAKFVNVPLQGHADEVAAMLRGDVDVASGTFAGYKSEVEAGQLRAIGVSAEKRISYLPDVPTYHEVGINAPTAANVRYIWVRKDVPNGVKATLSEAFKKMVEDPKVIERVTRLDQHIEYHGAKEAMQMAKEESAFYENLINKFGLKAKIK
jgi:putative tricarboxylic transport membrane protein